LVAGVMTNSQTLWEEPLSQWSNSEQPLYSCCIFTNLIAQDTFFLFSPCQQSNHCC
jgi:hypothetical protein